MHYYKRNLGDYAKKAGRLSMLQHGSYTLLIDACYDREQFPTLDEAIEWTWASTTEEIEAVTFVLRKFFTLDGDVYVQKRIQDEIDEYHSKSEINKRIATEREAKRRENSTKRERSVNEAPPNQEPLTNNQEPNIKTAPKKPRNSTKSFLPNDFKVSERVEVWAKEKGFANLDRHLENFVSACKAKGYKYVDFDEALMNAIRNNWAKVEAPRSTTGAAQLEDIRWRGAK